MKKTLLALSLVLSSLSFAQVSNYTFSASAGTYTPITGGTVVVWPGGTSVFDNDLTASIPMPNFIYNCAVYSACKINSNGFIALGTYTQGLNNFPLSGTVNASGGLIVAFGKDLTNSALGSPEVRYETVGNEFVVQYQDVRRSGTVGEQFSFQIRLNNTDNSIKFIYGPATLGVNSTYPEIGLKGVNNVFPANVKNITKACGNPGWLDVLPGTAATSKVCFSVNETFPASGTTFTWTAPPGPAAPAAITGLATQCPGNTAQTYSVAAVTGATNYAWSVPTGWTITAGQGTTSITVTPGTTGQNGVVAVSALNSCGASPITALPVVVGDPTPATPGAIAGLATQCPGTVSQNYSISPVAGATTYTWTVPTGWTITAGQGTNSITVTAGASGQNGNVSVTAGNACGTSSVSIFPVVVAAGTPSAPGSISGSVSQCPGVTSQTYSIAAVTNATNYTWNVPTGWTITAGQGTTSITVTTGTTGQNGSVTVNASNGCGVSASTSLNATVGNPTPSAPGAITGTATQCPGLTTQTYSIAAVTNATTYNWTVPTGWAITAGQGTTSITVTTGTSGQNGNVTVNAGNACGTSNASSFAVTVAPAIPAAPGAITGTAQQCPGLTGQTYSITAVANATSYTWAVPTGWTITAGQGTTSITVTTGSYNQNGNITVNASNSCGSSSNASQTVIVNFGTPTTPNLGGISTTCPSQLVTFTLSPVSGATNYSWTVPLGWSIVSGQGTSILTVTTGSAGQNGNVTVNASNSCGTSGTAIWPVVVANGTPVAPGPITGTAAQCPAISSTYSIAAVTNATTYTWTVPTGWTITSGQGTTSITVTSGNAGQNGNITVTAGNSCGTSSASSFAVTVNPGTPANPGIIAGTAAQCPGVNQVYTVNPVSGATNYTWTVPTGWTIVSGQGSSNIVVTTGNPGQNGAISVTASNSCGTSGSSSTTVTVVTGAPATPGVISGVTSQCGNVAAQTYSVASVANATSYTWTVPSGWIIVNGAGSPSITVTTGSVGQNGTISVTASNGCGSSAAATLTVAVTAATPTAPTSITGTAAQCEGNTNQVYSVVPVAGATSYSWTVPTGWIIVSGAGTETITVNPGTAGQNGTISVTADNTCGASTATSLAVTVNPGTPTAPTAITGATIVCSGATAQNYSISTVANATTYTWTVPSGWTITAGAGTNAITVTAGSTGGTISVTAGNGCGTSSATTQAVTVNPLPTVSAGPDLTVCTYNFPVTVTATGNATTYSWSNGSSTAATSITAAGTYTVTGTLNGCTTQDQVIITSDPCLSIEELSIVVTLYPNPASGILNVELNTNENNDFEIYSVDGKLIAKGTIFGGSGQLNVQELANGRYMLRIGSIVERFEINN